MLAQATGELLKWIAEWVGFELMSFFKKNFQLIFKVWVANSIARNFGKILL